MWNEVGVGYGYVFRDREVFRVFSFFGSFGSFMFGEGVFRDFFR